MKRTSLTILGCSIAILLSTVAHSNDVGGLYVGGNIGLATVSDVDLSKAMGVELGMPVRVDLLIGPGLAVGAAAGYDFAGPARVESEIAYQRNGVDSINAWSSGEGILSALSGNVSYLTFLVNGYYDFHNKSRFTPYISGGVGIANISLDGLRIDATLIFSGAVSTDAPDEDDTVLSYQAGFGVGIAATEKVTIDIKYRYLGNTDPEIDSHDIAVSSHNILVGLRIDL